MALSFVLSSLDRNTRKGQLWILHLKRFDGADVRVSPVSLQSVLNGHVEFCVERPASGHLPQHPHKHHGHPLLTRRVDHHPGVEGGGRLVNFALTQAVGKVTAVTVVTDLPPLGSEDPFHREFVARHFHKFRLESENKCVHMYVNRW